jgi:hypothetical protein
MATKSKGQSAMVAVAQQLVAGTGKHLAGAPPVMILGSTLTGDQVAARLQRVVDLRAEVDSAKATTKAKLAAEQAEVPGLRAFIVAYLHYVKGAYGAQPDVLADFGVHPKERAPLTVEVRVAAVAKRAATRVARKTLGPKQRLKIKGDVSGVTITPVKSGGS